MYAPNLEFNTPVRVLRRVETIINGAPKISWTPVDHIAFCSFKAFHGSESLRAGAVGVLDGGTVTMWYDPLITAKDRLKINDDTNLQYEIINAPENVEMRNEYLILKVQRVVSA